MEFSITFMDNSRITGKAIKMTHNEIDVTNYSREEIMRCFIDRKDKIYIITENYETTFYVDNVRGFTI